MLLLLRSGYLIFIDSRRGRTVNHHSHCSISARSTHTHRHNLGGRRSCILDRNNTSAGEGNTIRPESVQSGMKAMPPAKANTQPESATASKVVSGTSMIARQFCAVTWYIKTTTRPKIQNFRRMRTVAEIEGISNLPK